MPRSTETSTSSALLGLIQKWASDHKTKTARLFYRDHASSVLRCGELPHLWQSTVLRASSPRPTWRIHIPATRTPRSSAPKAPPPARFQHANPPVLAGTAGRTTGTSPRGRRMWVQVRKLDGFGKWELFCKQGRGWQHRRTSLPWAPRAITYLILVL